MITVDQMLFFQALHLAKHDNILDFVMDGPNSVWVKLSVTEIYS